MIMNRLSLAVLGISLFALPAAADFDQDVQQAQAQMRAAVEQARVEVARGEIQRSAQALDAARLSAQAMLACRKDQACYGRALKAAEPGFHQAAALLRPLYPRFTTLSPEQKGRLRLAYASWTWSASRFYAAADELEDYALDNDFPEPPLDEVENLMIGLGDELRVFYGDSLVMPLARALFKNFPE